MKKKRSIYVLGLVILMVMSLVGCGSSSKTNFMASADGAMTESMDGGDLYYDESYDDYYEYESDWENGSSGNTTGNVNSNRKLIKTMSLSAETYEFDKLVGTVETRVNALGGYMESASIHTNYNDLKYGDFVIRIPVPNMDQLVNEVAEISNITDRDMSQRDVTLDYVDMESHKNALQAEEESLLALLANAQSIEDIITLQSRLSEVRYQIESMESQLRTMDNLVEYATINLTISEVEDYTPAPVKNPTVGERISAGFSNTMEDITEGCKNLIVEIAVNSPYLIIWIVILGGTALILRAIIKSAIKKGDENEAKRLKAQQEILMRQQQNMQGAPTGATQSVQKPEGNQNEQK